MMEFPQNIIKERKKKLKNRDLLIKVFSLLELETLLIRKHCNSVNIIIRDLVFIKII